MGEHALAVSGLVKRYKGFTLSDISFTVPRGTIVGLIGENGAGKSTTLYAILGLIRRDGGEVQCPLRKEGQLEAHPQGRGRGRRPGQLQPQVKEEIGVVFDGTNFSEELTPKKLNKVLREIYASWDEPYFHALLGRLALPAGEKIKTYSKGMRAKLSIAVALAHHPKLLILDEATSGLDPVIRDDILDMLLDFVQDEENAVLLSSHITSDLEKVADFIVFIHEGRMVFSVPKDELLEHYGVVKCGAAQMETIDRQDMIACRRQDYGWQILVADRRAVERKYPKLMVAPTTIDEIMLLYVKGERP